jgi:gluconate 2-dehydrogenase
VCSLAVGYNNIDVPACTARGVAVSNAPGVLTETTADFGFALVMAAARRISESEAFLRRGEWTKWSVDLFAGSDVHGATLGILGMGRIGQAIARRGAHGFAMKVIYHNRSPLPAAEAESLGARYVSREALLREADHLVIVVPYSAESHHLVGAAELALMKPTATLVNIARGGVVDDVALAAALREGRIAAAGLDVFEGEPSGPSRPARLPQRRPHAAHRQRQPADATRDGVARRREPRLPARSGGGPAGADAAQPGGAGAPTVGASPQAAPAGTDRSATMRCRESPA